MSEKISIEFSSNTEIRANGMQTKIKKGAFVSLNIFLLKPQKQFLFLSRVV